jgi:hypothetical protein
MADKRPAAASDKFRIKKRKTLFGRLEHAGGTHVADSVEEKAVNQVFFFFSRRNLKR